MADGDVLSGGLPEPSDKGPEGGDVVPSSMPEADAALGVAAGRASPPPPSGSVCDGDGGAALGGLPNSDTQSESNIIHENENVQTYL